MDAPLVFIDIATLQQLSLYFFSCLYNVLYVMKHLVPVFTLGNQILTLVIK